MSDSMIERMARAICDVFVPAGPTEECFGCTYPTCNCCGMAEIGSMACAALDAIETPTEAMVRAMCAVDLNKVGLTGVFRAAIAAAKEEGKRKDKTPA